MNNMKTELKNEFQFTLRSQHNQIDQNQNEIKNMFACLMNNPSGSGPLPSNTIANLRVVERVPDVTKDTVQPSTKNIQPLVFQTQVLIDEPVVAPKPKPIIPYPSRANKQKLREKDDILALKFVEIFRNLHFNLTTTPVNENCSTVILKKLHEKLGDPGKFLIPCDFSKLVECLALADLGASINLLPLSIWKKLSLAELTLTRMILELADQWKTRPAGIAEDVFVKVGKFHFPTDFVVVDYVFDPQVSLILGRPFLRTGRALIDVYACDEYVQEVLGFSDNSKSGNPTLISDPIITLSSLSLTPFERGDFILEEIEACLTSKSFPPGINDTNFYPEGDIRLLEKLLNDDPSSSPLLPVKNEDLKQVYATMTKPSIEEPPKLELEELSSHLEYAFLERTDKLPVIISEELKDEEKSALLKGGMAVIKNEDNELIPTRLVIDWRVCIDYRKLNDATRKDHFSLPFMDQMLERLAGNEFYCFLDGFFGYFQILIDPQDQQKTTFTCPYGTLPTDVCLSVYAMLRARSKDKMLKRCEDTNLVLNWEKCHFMVKEGIVLGHKISKSGIEVDRAKVDVIAKLPHPTSVKGAENPAADHLSRLEDPHQDELKKKEVTETLPLETLGMIAFRGDLSTQCAKKVFDSGFIGRLFTEMPMTWSHGVMLVNVKAKSSNVMKCLKMQFKFARFLTFGASTLWDRSRLLEETNTFSWPLTICLNEWKQRRFPLMMPELLDCSDFEDSRACGFVLRSLELQSLAYGNPIS
uniref:Reverse transcriptase domain-containing protein n=1 Tax=Tanacetum cinerariifolium TaxID=118510 RepID=A0A6L2NP60_TANCI|nr:reverse transcriptase domain-containing protein [Tanacetum cinerariifolium]